MANINDLKRQHKEIREMIDFMKINLTEDKVVSEASKLAQNVSILAGKLRMHLLSEDESLYPKLLGGSDERIKNTARRFFEEMGNLSQVFAEYKSKYNISSRILKDIDTYIEDTNAIVEALENRIGREDEELYILL